MFKLLLVVVIVVPACSMCLADACGQNMAAGTVIVRVPAGARLYINGQLMHASGNVRRFDIPYLPAGKPVTYEFRAEVVRQGRPISESKQVLVRARQTTEVDFSSLDPVAPAPGPIGAKLPEVTHQGQPVSESKGKPAPAHPVTEPVTEEETLTKLGRVPTNPAPLGVGPPVKVTSVPSQYRVLAERLAQPTKTSPDAFRDNKELTEIIAEGHSAVLDLQYIKANSTDTEITYIADLGKAALSEAVSRLERLNALPKPPSADRLFVESLIHGLFGNVYASYALGLEAQQKQDAINAELLGFLAAVEKAEAAHLLLPRVAEKYAAPIAANNARIGADYDQIWGGGFSHNYLRLHNNSGSEIHDCTILVEIKGENGQLIKNVHFVPSWGVDSVIYCRYDTGKVVLDRIFGARTVDKVDTVAVSIFSPTFATNISYKYSGEEADKDIKSFCDKTRFSLRYQPFVPGLFWDTQRGAYIKLEEGVRWIPKCEVELTFKNGLQSKTWRWSFDRWDKGEEKRFDTPKGGLTFDPKSIELVISFPNTKARIERTFEVR
jgi:uncharacterized protein (TIGR03000 family)